MTPAEYDWVKLTAEAQGLTVASLVRRLLLDEIRAERHVAGLPAELAEPGR
jgi:hypothetical protein